MPMHLSRPGSIRSGPGRQAHASNLPSHSNRRGEAEQRRSGRDQTRGGRNRGGEERPKWPLRKAASPGASRRTVKPETPAGSATKQTPHWLQAQECPVQQSSRSHCWYSWEWPTDPSALPPQCTDTIRCVPSADPPEAETAACSPCSGAKLSARSKRKASIFFTGRAMGNG